MAQEEKNEKIFVADDTVLRYHPRACERFATKGNTIVILNSVLSIIQQRASLSYDEKLMADQISDALSRFEHPGLMTTGVSTESGGVIVVGANVVKPKRSQFPSIPKTVDLRGQNSIIFDVLDLKRRYPNKEVVLVTKDFYLRALANVCGVNAQDYKYDRIASLFTTVTRLILNVDYENAIVQELSEKSCVNADAVFAATKEKDLLPNSCCVIMHSSGTEFPVIYKRANKTFQVVKPFYVVKEKRRIFPRNLHQMFFYHMLLDPTIREIGVVGVAGSGKTILPLQAAYEMRQSLYRKALVIRPTIEMGEKQGFLPGTKQQKFEPWKQVVYDAVREIIGTLSDDEKDDKFPVHAHDEGARVHSSIQALLDSGWLHVDSPTYLQGCTVRNSMMITDETQNITIDTMRTLATRLGKGSKLVVTGDVTQVHNPKAKDLANGLVWFVENMRGLENFGHIALIKCERDPEVEAMLSRFNM